LLDKPLAESAIKYASVELEEIEKIVAEVTEGAIMSVRSPKMREWVLERVGDEAKKLMEVYKDGEKKYSIDKSVRANLLILAEENPDEVPPQVADVIQCATDLWASSVAKFNRLKELADEEDNRVRGAFIFAGGSATGRTSSYGVQFQNMPRKIAENPAAVRQAMVRGHAIVPTFGRKVTDVLKSMLRPALIPAKGNVFVCYDWNAIEARVNPWLSNHASAQEVLDVFKSNKDVYIREAAGIFHCEEKDVTPQQRSIGKVAILACAFGGSVGAFEAMGRIYGIHLPESDAKRTVNAWRRSNPWAVQAWGKLESAYTRAMRNKNHEFTADKITYLFDGLHLWYALPSGRVLCYPFARLDEDGITYAKAAWKPAATDKEWPRARLWHGIAIENCVQATANDLLRHACRVLDQEGFATVATIHDEILVECKEAEADRVCRRMKEIMLTPPKWCQDLPLAVAGGVIQHYE
jgi:DNA polymerase